MAKGILRKSQYVAVGASSAKFTNAMVENQVYLLSANTDCWVHIGATGGAAAADTADNHMYIKGQHLLLRAPDDTNGFVHVIQDSAAGDATLSLVE